MTNYKMGSYKFPTKKLKKPIRKYNRKNQFNKTYKGKYTKKELARRVKIARTVLIVIAIIGISQWLSIPRTITIQGSNDAVVKETELVAPVAQKVVGASIDNLPAPIAPVEDLTVKEQIREIAKEHNFKQEELLVKIAFCESSFNPLAINYNTNGSSDYGLFQYNSIHNFGELPLDIKWSTEKTIEWIRAGKLHAWNSSKKCWSK